MKNFVLGLIFGAILLAGAIWYFGNERHRHAATVRQDLSRAASHTMDTVGEKLGLTDLTAADIKEELARTGRVVRRKAEELGASLADATADPRIVTTIKTKLVADQVLSALKISVSSSNGNVTLSGTAASPDAIREAMKVAMATDGVRKVVSTLKLDDAPATKSN